ncbi:MAG: YceI family protein [Oligoflexales bacterium]
MKKILFFALLFLQTHSYGAACFYKMETPKLTWSGYKFMSKFAVNGTFDNITLVHSQKPENDMDAFLKSILFDIDVASLNSGMDIRDKKLVLYLFGGLKNPGHIRGRIKSSDIHHGTGLAEISLNGVRKDVVFSVSQDGSSMSWKGKIDMLDFKMNDAFKSIHTACKELHTGPDGKSKTWSEVGLEITTKITKKC